MSIKQNSKKKIKLKMWIKREIKNFMMENKNLI